MAGLTLASWSVGRSLAHCPLSSSFSSRLEISNSWRTSSSCSSSPIHRLSRSKFLSLSSTFSVGSKLWGSPDGGVPGCENIWRLPALGDSVDRAGTPTVARWSLNKAETEVAVVAVATALLATTNKISYKMALVPMKQYPFFLAQVTTFGYVLVYSTILYGRYKAGIVTEDMLGIPKDQFVALGALEALGLATGMAAAAVLPAASIPVLMQVLLVWQLLLSAAFLGKRYTKGQIAGCLLVVTGVVIVVVSGGASEALHRTGPFWPLVMVVSSLFSAGGSILKESIFEKARYQVKGGSVDIFVVNSLGSSFQALFVLLLLPLLSNLRGIPFHQLGNYLQAGSACFFNLGSPVGCEGSPWVPLLYVIVNLSFNISALYLMKISSAIIASLCTTASVPLAILAFTLRLPYLGSPPPIPPKLFVGSAILVIGLAAYNLANPKVQAKLETDHCGMPLHKN